MREERERRVVWSGEHRKTKRDKLDKLDSEMRDVPSLVFIEDCPSVHILVFVKIRDCRTVKIYEDVICVCRRTQLSCPTRRLCELGRLNGSATPFAQG
jgi:hypothetical protein